MDSTRPTHVLPDARFRPGPGPTRRWLGGLGLLVGFASLLHAQGSPPIITDDPGTPGSSRWEINLGGSLDQRAGVRTSELPLLDVSYGLGDRLQIKYAVPYVRLSEEGAPTVSGWGNSTMGVKWRFHETGGTGLSASIHPQFEFNTPGADSDDKGLAAHGSIFLLPFQFEKLVGPVRVIWEVGREFHPDGDAWFYGAAASHRFTSRVEIALELAGGGSPHLDRTRLTANIAVAIDCSERSSVMFSIGRELHNHDEARATLVGFLGLQWRL